jgi:integrase/recombinase XerD
LYPKAVKAIEDYLAKSRPYFTADDAEDALFVNTNGERMTRQGLWKIIKIYAEQAGIKKSITPHTLRHSFATHLLQNGADIHDIKDILGHSDIASTNVYSDFLKSRVKNTYLRFNHRSR